MSRIRVGVIGASGYTGLELIKIVLNHPHFELSYLATSSGGTTLDKLHQSLLGICDMDVQKADANLCAKSCELVFLALPHKTAMELVSPLISLGVSVVDLSADYRLPQDIYEKFYTSHSDLANLSHAVYGLPELYRDEIKEAKLVANPGCFPTSAILALLPFLKYITKGSSIVIDAKTGVSGAGKKLSDNTHFVNIHENLFAYNPLGHRHAPEIANKLDIELGRINFVPHLVPVTRGMISSIYIELDDRIDANRVLEEYYGGEEFVRVVDRCVDMKSVAGTNFCDIYAKSNANRLYISSAIDNLMRGASSQAVVNANIMMGLDESSGIPKIAYVP